MFLALMWLLIAADEPVAVAPPPVITPIPPAPPNQALPNGVKNLVSLFSTDDYPVAAIRAGEEGTTQVRLLVTPEGRVGQCEVLMSSGSPTLDRATCEILQRRARFKPALDSQGRPTTDYFTQRVRWELPAMSFQDEYARAVLELDPESGRPACVLEEEVNLEVTCESFEPIKESIFANAWLPPTGALVVEMGQRVGRGEALLRAGVGPGPQSLTLVAVTLAVGADGRVTECAASFPQLDEAEALTECREAQRWKFEPLDGQGAGRPPRYITSYRLSYLRK